MAGSDYINANFIDVSDLEISLLHTKFKEEDVENFSDSVRLFWIFKMIHIVQWSSTINDNKLLLQSFDLVVVFCVAYLF